MQFDIYENKNLATNRRFPYLLDVQANLLESLETRVVVPLIAAKDSQDLTVTRLMPTLTVKDKKYVAFTPQMAGVPSREFGPPVTNVSKRRDDIIAALDLLF